MTAAPMCGTPPHAAEVSVSARFASERCQARGGGSSGASAGDSGARTSPVRTSAFRSASVTRCVATAMVAVGPHGATEVQPSAHGRLQPSFIGVAGSPSGLAGPLMSIPAMSMPGISAIPDIGVEFAAIRSHAADAPSANSPSPTAMTFSIRRNTVAAVVRRSMLQCVWLLPGSPAGIA